MKNKKEWGGTSASSETGEMIGGTMASSMYKKGGKLKGNQKKLDVNKNGKLDAEDFKMLRSGKKMANGGSLADVPESFPNTDPISYADGGGVGEESRITFGEEKIYLLNDEPLSIVVKNYKDKDIFFTKNNKAVVTNRTSNIIYHGKDKGKFIKDDNVKYIYAGPEGEFYSKEDYKKLLNAVYYGRKPRINPIDITKMAKGGGVGEKFKAGDYVFAKANRFDTRIKDESAKIPFFVSHWSHDKYYVLGDGSHYLAEDELTKATEKDFNDYYGENASENYKHILKEEYAKGGSTGAWEYSIGGL